MRGLLSSDNVLKRLVGTLHMTPRCHVKRSQGPGVFADESLVTSLEIGENGGRHIAHQGVLSRSDVEGQVAWGGVVWEY